MFFFVKRRSRVLRRRTRIIALDKPRVHDGQLGFAILEQKAAETAENRAFEEKQPLVFYQKPRIHGFMVEWDLRRRESGAGGGGGEREVKIRRHTIPRIGRAYKEN